MDRPELVRFVASQTRNVVQTGPFRGMRLSSQGSWGDGDIAAKLLGIYEEELHPYFDRFARLSYDEVIDVGAAEGYYAVGCALLFKKTIVRAFDTSELSHAILHENGRLNEVANRLIIGGLCSGGTLMEIASGRRILAILDCEGGELELLREPAVVQSLQHSDLVIECHDFIDPSTTGTLIGKLSSTHMITIVYAGARNPNQFPFLAGLSDHERWLAISENRPVLMHWIICMSKRPVRG